MANTTLKKNDSLAELTLLDFKTYYKEIVIKTVCYWGKNRQNNRTKQRAQEYSLINIVN